MRALDAIVEPEFHVVAKIVEAELIVGAIGDVGVISGLALVIVKVVNDDAGGKSEKLVQAAHPFGIAASEIVVDGNDVYALAG